MGANQSNIGEELRHGYGVLKNTQAELSQRLSKVELLQINNEQEFANKCEEIKKIIEALKHQLRELKHEYAVDKQSIDEEVVELKAQIQELTGTLNGIKLGEMRNRKTSFGMRQS